MRAITAALVVLTLTFTFAGRTQADEAGEQKLIADITTTATKLDAELARCDPRTPACDPAAVARLRIALRTLRERVDELRNDLQARANVTHDLPVLQGLHARIELLAVADHSADTELNKAPPPLTAKSVEDAKTVDDENKLTAEIKELVARIKDASVLCESHDLLCNRAELSRMRFELRDRLAEAAKLRDGLLKQEADAEPDDTEGLSHRAADLLRGINSARGITFDTQATMSPGNELVETVKALNKSLDDKERQLDQARETHNGVDISRLKEEIRNTGSDLAKLERPLRAQGVEDRKAIGEIDKKLKSGALTPAQYASKVDEKKQLTSRLEATEGLVTLPSDENPLFRVFDDDADNWWIHEFYLGMEFDSVTGIFNKGFARLGYSSWFRVGGENIPESHPSRGFRTYARFYEFNALLTSSAEQKFKGFGTSDTTNADPCSAGFTGTDPCVRKALETEFKAFFPVLRTPRHNRLQPYFGPVFAIGARFTDPLPHDSGVDGLGLVHASATTTAAVEDTSRRVDYRYYGGVHWGFARDAYGEVLYGRTRSLDTRRLEIRGEIPVAHFGNDSRLLLGWAANLGAGHRRTRLISGTDVEGNPLIPVPERDVFRVFLVYNLDFLKLPIGVTAPKTE